MPVIGGVQAVRELRGREASAGRWPTPVLALAANAMDGQTASYRLAGMDGFVEKPLDMAKLFEAIQAVLQPDDPGANPGAACSHAPQFRERSAGRS